MQLLEVGATFCNRFRLVSLLGSGSLGEVWRAHDRESSVDVALRFCNPTDPVGDSVFSRFAEAVRRERIDNRRCHHPGLIGVLGVYADDGRCFLSMPLVDGKNLTSLRDGSIDAAIGTVLRVCDTLEYAHAEGFVHGGIRLASIMVDRRSRVLLTDFGIERFAVEAGIFPVGRGSLGATSPQVLDGRPATVADDVYSIGALLFELVTGGPLFGASVTRDRVMGERPVIPVKSASNAPLPDSLIALLRAMLDKRAESRPPGISSVRAVLTDVRQDLAGSTRSDPRQSDDAEETIEPVGRRERASAPPSVRAKRADPLRAKTHTFPAVVVYGGFALLALIALGVVFVLPRIVQNTGPIQIERPSISESVLSDDDASRSSDPRALQAQKELAEKALGKVLASMDQLQGIGVDLWGGADWSEARRYAAAGDTALKSREYTVALGQYQQSGVLLELLQRSSDAVLKAALADGEQAFRDNDAAGAVRAFEIVLAIDKENEAARQGLERAMLLPKLIELATAASELEAAEDYVGAMELYTRARSLDAEWRIAREGADRLTATIARNDYEALMARGFSELSNDDLDAARQAFEAALTVRPGDADANTALSQIGGMRKFRRISVYQARAEEAAAAESWNDAISAYESALEIDATVNSLIDGLARSRARAELDLRLEEYIAKADRFNRVSIANQARDVLRDAGKIVDSGPKLQGQIGNLSKLLATAQIPIPIQVESDNLTRVSINRVGQFGIFHTKTVNLKPGRYVAVGIRDGFRDVRHEFIVTADGSLSAIVIRCEEPI